MNGQISFDTVLPESGQDHLEGCYKLDGDNWKVFYLTHRKNGAWWTGTPIVVPDAVWKSSVKGIDAVYPMEVILNKSTAMELLSGILGGVQWTEIKGPDSLQMK